MGVAGLEPATRLPCFVATPHGIDGYPPMTLPTELHTHASLSLHGSSPWRTTIETTSPVNAYRIW